MSIVAAILEHPSPAVVAVQRRIAAAVIAAAFAGVALGRLLWPKD